MKSRTWNSSIHEAKFKINGCTLAQQWCDQHGGHQKGKVLPTDGYFPLQLLLELEPEKKRHFSLWANVHVWDFGSFESVLRILSIKCIRSYNSSNKSQVYPGVKLQ